MEELGLTPEQRQGMVDVYTHLQAALPEFDRQHADGAREVMAEALGGKAQLAPAIEDIDGYLRDGQRISPELAEGIMRARLPGGQRLLNHPEFSLLLLSLARSTSEARVGDAEEYAALNDMLQTDLDQYRHGCWRGSDQTPADRLMQLERRYSGLTQANTTSAREPMSSLEQRLEEHLNSDIVSFQNDRIYGPNKSMTGSEMMLALARQREGRR
jgi:hypothetical protein